MKTPRFSVIIPTLNEENFLPKLLESLLRQTNKDFEVVLVDGGSKDNTVAIARLYKKKLPLFTLMQSEIAGVSQQRNKGAAVAKGDWLVFIDADSVLLPYAMERINAFIQERNPTIFTTWFRPDSETISDAMVTLFFNMIFEGAILLHRPFTQGAFAAVKNDAFHMVGGYDEALAFGEDYDLTKRICQMNHKLEVLRETLYVYSLRRFRYQGTLKTMQAGTKTVFSVLLMNKTPRSIAGYVMGGQLYDKKRQVIKQSAAKRFQFRLAALLKELFE